MWKRLPPRRFCWLHVVLTLAWFVVLYHYLDTWPTATLHMHEHRTMNSRRVEAVSDDGSYVVFGYGPNQLDDNLPEPQFWDTRTGTRFRPPLFADLEPMKQLTLPSLTSYAHLLESEAGRRLLFDADAWQAMRQRFRTHLQQTPTWSKATPSERLKLDANPWPRWCQFNRDGRYLAYHSVAGRAVFHTTEGPPDGLTVEDARTGKRLAFLPQAWHLYDVAPDDQTIITDLPQPFAATRSQPENELDVPRMALWDTATATVRARLSMPVRGLLPRFVGSLYVHCWYPVPNGRQRVRWWDTMGQQRGDTFCGMAFTELPDRQTFVCRATSPLQTTLEFWDLASGTKRAEWDMGSLEQAGGTFDYFKAAPKAPLFVANWYRGKATMTSWEWFQTRLDASFGWDPEGDRSVVFNDETRTRVAWLRGANGVFSDNGQWIATTDDGGAIRVWQLPLRRPWWLIVGGAIVGGFALGVRCY